MAEQNFFLHNYDDLHLSVPFLADNDRMPPDTSRPAATPAVATTSTALPSSSSTPPKTPPTRPRRFSSPLNPSTPSSIRSSGPSSIARMVSRIPSDEARAFSQPSGFNTEPSRGSMILYRFADSSSSSPSSNDILLPPQPSHLHRSSIYSTSGDSISSDSKYPLMSQIEHGLVAYAYDPDGDEKAPLDEEDMMHDPTQRYHHNMRKGKAEGTFNSRALLNISTLVALVVGVMVLFVGYPAIAFYRDNGRNTLIVENILINSTGQLP